MVLCPAEVLICSSHPFDHLRNSCSASQTSMSSAKPSLTSKAHWSQSLLFMGLHVFVWYSYLCNPSVREEDGIRSNLLPSWDCRNSYKTEGDGSMLLAWDGSCWSHPEAETETKVRTCEGGDFWEDFREPNEQDGKGCETRRRWVKEYLVKPATGVILLELRSTAYALSPTPTPRGKLKGLPMKFVPNYRLSRCFLSDLG